ncbi:MAG: DUF917 family protein [Thermodesulfobacteriota bacterium]|nr:DUF917 family protein [Thermodesulfobacteriota bacterium]
MGLTKNFVKGDYYPNPLAPLISRDEAIKAGGMAVVVAYLGAPEALKKAAYPDGPVDAVKWVKDNLKQQGKELKYVAPVEIGSLSSVVPCLVAAKLGLNVIDADGAGRAVPELTMLTFAANQISVNPTVMANINDLCIAINVDESKADSCSQIAQENAAALVEQIARPVVGIKQFNEIAGIAIWVMDAGDIRKALPITGTLTTALAVGRVIPQSNAEDIIEFLKTNCHMKVFPLFKGHFIAEGVASLTSGGFDHGRITLVNSERKEKYTGVFQNETLIVWSTGCDHPLAIAPDSIAYFVKDDQKVYSNGDIITEDGNLVTDLEGKEATVIGIAAHEALREGEKSVLSSDLYLQRLGKGEIMRCFQQTLLDLGYGGKYIEIEKLYEEYKL